MIKADGEKKTFKMLMVNTHVGRLSALSNHQTVGNQFGRIQTSKAKSQNGCRPRDLPASCQKMENSVISLTGIIAVVLALLRRRILNHYNV